MTHAQTVTANLGRLDSSTFEVADFNPTTEALLSQTTFVRWVFQYLDLGARGGPGLVWIRAGLRNLG